MRFLKTTLIVFNVVLMELLCFQWTVQLFLCFSSVVLSNRWCATVLLFYFGRFVIRTNGLHVAECLFYILQV